MMMMMMMMMKTMVGLALIGLLVCCCLAQTTEDQQDRQTRNSSQLKDADTNNTHCRQPMKVGSCRASMLRFFYNVTIQKCSNFTFGGCEANNNNFLSEEQCNATCSGVSGSVLPDESTPAPALKRARMVPAQSEHPPKNGVSADDFTEHCQAEPQSGPCKAAFQRWFYNKETGSCESFIYGGCRPNKNNYLSKESCIATCTVSVLPSSKKTSGEDEPSVDFSKHCLVTSDPGLCRAAFTMFYYDSDSGSCRSFIYGGCGGNENRYGTVEECERRCSREGSFDGLGKSRHRWTAAFFLFATLAVISALLLVTLVIITLRRRRLSRSVSSLSDKQGLLPDEQLSVDSLTLPESPAPPHKA